MKTSNQLKALVRNLSKLKVDYTIFRAALKKTVEMRPLESCKAGMV